MLQMDNEEDRMLIRNIELEYDKWCNVKVGPIIRKIAEMGFPVKDCIISYYSITDRVFVFIGKEPI